MLIPFARASALRNRHATAWTGELAQFCGFLFCGTITITITVTTTITITITIICFIIISNRHATAWTIGRHAGDEGAPGAGVNVIYNLPPLIINPLSKKPTLLGISFLNNKPP